jgi:hypothetical protein
MDDVPDLPKVKDVSMSNEKCKSFQIEARSISESIKKILEIF